MKEKNLAVEVLERLLKGDQEPVREQRSAESASSPSCCKNSLTRYRNRAIETAQVIEELIAMAKQFKAAANRGEELGLKPRGDGLL